MSTARHHKDEFPVVLPNANSISSRKPVLGIGVNDAPYVVEPTVGGKRFHCPFYLVWRSMIKRCYDQNPRTKLLVYAECTVVDEWLKSFMVFKSWMEQQNWRGKHLDKDLLKPGNKIYGPSTCLFVPQAVNHLFGSNAASRGAYPVGVHLNKKDKRFLAQIKMGGQTVPLGSFHTPEEANAAWLRAKVANVLAAANATTDNKLADALRRNAHELLLGTHPMLRHCEGGAS